MAGAPMSAARYQAPAAKRRPRSTRSAYRFGRHWWRRNVIGGVDHARVVARVDGEAGWSPRYLFMAVMSAGIAILGLLLSSPAVVIGAMLISPLMGPIIGLGFALAIFEWREVTRSIAALVGGCGLAVAICALIVLLSPLQTVTPEILARTRPNLFDLLVAIFSALAGTYAMIRGRGETVVGVAIATALMPPLAVVGFGLATWNTAVFGGAAALFLTNLIAIALSAAIMARLYGFGERLSPKQTRLQALLIVGVFVVLAIPLALSLRHIAWEAVASRQVRAALVDHFGSGSRVSQLEIDFAGETPSARAVVLTDRYRPGAAGEINAQLEASLGAPLRLSVNQVVVDQDLSRLEQERAALAQSAATKNASLDAEASDIAVAVAMLAGISPQAVALDRDGKRVTVVVSSLPGASLAAWRALEERVQRQHPAWRIEVVPPMGALPRVRFAPGTADLSEAGGASVAAIGWALERWRIRNVLAVGRAASEGDTFPRRTDDLALERARRVAEGLVALGVAVDVAVDPVGPIQRTAEREEGRAAYRSVEIRPQSPEVTAADGADEPLP